MKELELNKEGKVKIFMVRFDWAVDEGESDTEIYLFFTKEDAKAKFNELVLDEKTNENGWVCSALSDENYEEDYEGDDDDGYFSIWEKGNYCGRHSTISIVETFVE